MGLFDDPCFKSLRFFFFPFDYSIKYLFRIQTQDMTILIHFRNSSSRIRLLWRWVHCGSREGFLETLHLQKDLRCNLIQLFYHLYYFRFDDDRVDKSRKYTFHPSLVVNNNKGWCRVTTMSFLKSKLVLKYSVYNFKKSCDFYEIKGKV